MANIPRAVLSEHFQNLMQGKVLKTGIFLTFMFDPAFFEEEILPVFLDLPLSHEPNVRMVQLEDAIRKQIDHLAVYYDHGALQLDSTGARLDVRRIPIVWPTGYFHAKNVFLIVESAEADEDSQKEQSLIVSALSANLTRAGWWENVEVCHTEEVFPDDKSFLREDIFKLINSVKSAAPAGIDHHALDTVRSFLFKIRKRNMKSTDGVLNQRLYSTSKSVPDFLDEVRGEKLRRLNLEVISPYFDESPDASTLGQLIERFEPREVRVFLPSGKDGAALCRPEFFDAVRKLEKTAWAHLPKDLLKSGDSESAAPRRVHAKAYRFFHPYQKYEALFVGSVNLTGAAHSRGGNFETGFLLETDPGRVPDWWMTPVREKPPYFQEELEAEGSSVKSGIPLLIRFDWSRLAGEALWDGTEASPQMHVQAQGSPLFDLGPLQPGTWTALAAEQIPKLEKILRTSTSILTILVEDKPDATILVLEENMAQKPSILLNLSAADILKCWSCLTPEQKAVLLEERYQELMAVASAHLPGAQSILQPTHSIFDEFAGIFHAFGSLERQAIKALEEGREKEAIYLLFGRKYDSLHRLLDRVLNEEKSLDRVNRYVMLLCARQVVDRIREYARDRDCDFAFRYKTEIEDLKKRLESSNELRQGLAFGGTTEERDNFLDWFEEWFLHRAKPQEAKP